MRILLSLFLIVACGSPQNKESVQTPKSTEEIRCAFDIGSGTTKVQVAKVDPNSQLVTQTLFRADKQVDYLGNLIEEGGRFKINATAKEAGVQAIRELLNAAREKANHPNLECRGVATEVFRRTGEDGQRFINRLNDISKGFWVQIISQEEEGFLGFFGGYSKVAALRKVEASSVLVWDIGGGSQQMVYQNPESKKLAIQTEKRWASSEWSKELSRKFGSRGKIPDLTGSKSEQALQMARKLATNPTLAAVIHDQIKTIVGIGGVLAKSVAEQVGKSEFTRSDIEKAISVRKNWEERDLGPYASKQVSNLILVLGYMEALGIEKIITFPIDLTDGLLANPKYWVKRPS